MPRELDAVPRPPPNLRARASRNGASGSMVKTLFTRPTLAAVQEFVGRPQIFRRSDVIAVRAVLKPVKPSLRSASLHTILFEKIFSRRRKGRFEICAAIITRRPRRQQVLRESLPLSSMKKSPSFEKPRAFFVRITSKVYP